MFELLYVDHDRLQSYVEQSGGRSRRVPSFSGALGLSGPSVGVTWTRPELSKIHEQIGTVRAYLARQKLLSYQRPSEQDRWDLGKARYLEPEGDQSPETRQDLLALFREETLELQSVYLPPNEDPLLKNGLSLWISDQYPELGLLLLIENFPLPDQPWAIAISGYTLLTMVNREFRGSVQFPNVPGIGRNPRQALEMLGARIGPPKMVTVLYRVRATFAEEERGFSLTTIGYPIAIWRE